MVLRLKNFSIDFLRHASTLISFGEKKIYIDPWKLPLNPPKADLILVTHEHYDHCDQKAINAISQSGTIIVTNQSCASKLGGKIKTLRVGETINLSGVEIFGVAAYNVEKKFHPKGLVIGFVLDFNGERVYHAGDTDFIPEMNYLKDITVALLPIGGTYTMNEKEAAQAANAFLPKMVVPMHFNVVEGTSADPDKFASLVSKKVKVKILCR